MNTDFEKQIDMFILNDEKLLRQAKTMGFSDKMIAKLINKEDNLELTSNDIYFARNKLGIDFEYNEVHNVSNVLLTHPFYQPTNKRLKMKEVRLGIIGLGLASGLDFADSTTDDLHQGSRCQEIHAAVHELAVTELRRNGFVKGTLFTISVGLCKELNGVKLQRLL